MGLTDTIVLSGGKEELGDNILDKAEINALQEIKKAIEAMSVKHSGEITNARNTESIIDSKFSIGSKVFDNNKKEFQFNKAKTLIGNNEKNRLSANERTLLKSKISLFYNSLLKDIWSAYNNIDQTTENYLEQEKSLLTLGAFFINMYESGGAMGLPNDGISKLTMRQLEYKLKSAVRGVENRETQNKGVITSERNDEYMLKHGFSYVREMTEAIPNSITVSNARYKLPMAKTGAKDIEQHLSTLKNELSADGVVIDGFDITGLASSVNFSGDNEKLARDRSESAKNWLLANFKDKMTEGYQSTVGYKTDVGVSEGIDYNDPLHPEYKKYANTQEGRNKLENIFGKYQGVDIKVRYHKEQKKNIYEKRGGRGTMSANDKPKVEIVVIGDDGKQRQIELGSNQLNTSDTLKLRTIANQTANFKNKNMWKGQNGKKSFVSLKYDEYKSLSQMDPQRYPKIIDPKKDLSRIDKIPHWENRMDYGKKSKANETVIKTPILHLDLKNSIDVEIYKDMQRIGIDKGVSSDVTDKYLSQKINEWTKKYVKNGIDNREI